MIGGEALQPNPVLRPFEVLVGEWRTSGNRLEWQRDEAGFAQRNTLVIDDNGSRMIGTGEMSRSDGEWEGDLSLTYERIS